MEVFEKLLDQELYSYFKTAKFYANPVFHAAHKVVDFYVEFENVIPLQIYEQIITKLQFALHVHVRLHIHVRNNKVEMDELDRYVNHFVEKYADIKDFRFLHPYIEKDTICFSTRDEARLAALNLAYDLTKELTLESNVALHNIKDATFSSVNKDLKIKVEKELAKTMRPRKETINKILNKFNDLIK